MKGFADLKVGGRLILGFSVMILFMAGIGFAGFRSIHQINGNLEEIFAVNLPSMDYLLETDRDLQQLLVAERSLIFSNARSEIFKKLVEEYEENLQQSDARWEKYKALAETPEEKELIAGYEKAREEWKAVSRRVVEGRAADTREGRRESLDLTLGQARERFEQMRTYLDKLTGISLDLAREDRETASETYRNTLMFLFGALGLGLLAGIILMWVIGRGITRPLKNVIEGLSAASDRVACGSSQVASSSQHLAEGASEQAASIEETSSSLEEMSSMTRQNAENAVQADSLMKEANDVVGQANRSMEELTASMEEITGASEETSKIVKTIDEIAFQTNLLALNAAVEAARAGEAGAGFAVVADEVRNLAMRAADAAKNTASLIEGTVKKVKDGSELVARTNEAFSGVAKSASRVGELVAEIAAASGEQAQGIEQVNVAVAEMDKVVQRVAANAEESASASEEMNAQAEHLKGYVAELTHLIRRTRDISEEASADEPPPTGDRNRQRTGAGRGALKTRKAKALEAGRAPVDSPEVSPEQVIPLDDDQFKDF